MTSQEIDRFFQVFAKQLDQRVKVILTGAAAGSLWGYVRPSLDIDFAIERLGRGGQWQEVDDALNRTMKLTGISAQYAQDIDRWGQVSLLDYKHHTALYKRFGVIEVRTLDPVYWSIGKVTRYLDPDLHDMVEVFSRRNISATRLIRVWGTAVKSSPASTARFEFTRHVEHFLGEYGRTIWGSTFDPPSAVRAFYQHAGIKRGR